MLSQVLPGLREIRSAVVAGLCLLVAGWIALDPSGVSTSGRAWRLWNELGSFLGPLLGVGVILLAAYLIGDMWVQTIGSFASNRISKAFEDENRLYKHMRAKSPAQPSSRLRRRTKKTEDRIKQGLTWLVGRPPQGGLTDTEYRILGTRLVTSAARVRTEIVLDQHLPPNPSEFAIHYLEGLYRPGDSPGEDKGNHDENVAAAAEQILFELREGQLERRLAALADQAGPYAEVTRLSSEVAFARHMFLPVLLLGVAAWARSPLAEWQSAFLFFGLVAVLVMRLWATGRTHVELMRLRTRLVNAGVAGTDTLEEFEDFPTTRLDDPTPSE